MKEFLAGIFPAQNLSEGAREGLPYWIFWLLLCIIVLLLAFIFLRDKDLRRRLDTFFARVKKRLIKLRLQSLFKKESKKQDGFLNELGRKAWEIDIKIPFGETIWEQINKLEKKKIDLKMENTDFEAKITKLKETLNEFLKNYEAQSTHLESDKNPFNQRFAEIKQKEKETENQVLQEQSNLEENIKQMNVLKKEIMNLAANAELNEEEKSKNKKEIEQKIKPFSIKIEKLNQNIKALVEKKEDLEKESQEQSQRIDEINHKIKKLAENKKHQSRKYQKEIKEWEKSKEKIQEKIRGIEKQNNPLFTGLGRLINENRIEHKELALFYSKIDRTVRRKLDIERQIQNLE